jgi:DNA polymerase elongation subunit (family B)
MSLQFQILGASAKDVEKAYQITLFGSDSEGKSVSLFITGFEPFFYVEIPSEWKRSDITAYEQYLLSKSRLVKNEHALVFMTTEKHKTFWDFTNGKMLTFLKIQATSKRVWTKMRNACMNSETATPIPFTLGKKSYTLRVFEANIDPLLRFFHMRELKPAGWAYIPEGEYDDDTSTNSSAALQFTAECSSIHPASNDIQLTSAPLRILSWDIECTSSHGDFPLAKKTWRKIARDIVESEYDFTDWADALNALRGAVRGTSKLLSRIYLGKYGEREFEQAITSASSDIQSDWESLDMNAEEVIDAIEALLNRHFPAPEGDPIIQIGSVLYVGGKAIQKDIFVLGDCDALKSEGINVYPCKTEAELIRGWCNLIEKLDPDSMVGYNIFGFDDKYLWDRATVTGCVPALKAFSRIQDKAPELQEKFLSSSAMGDNTFYVISAEGRLHIDLLAYVRRNNVLDSYSLDNVAATFMSGGIQSVSEFDAKESTWRIATKSTKGTTPGRFIVLMDEENDVIGYKHEVVRVEPKALYVRIVDKGEALRDHGPPPVKWAQSKDNVSPKDIFSLHAGSAADRAKVAKYCIQDCDLVMELFQKLEVLNNSIAMANVCWVPVEYIFTRGQGIKSESLVFYECRKEDQLIPVLPSPPRIEDEVQLDAEIIQDKSDLESYEGAIVLDPLTGIYLDDEPVAALDFSSLYPSSIISENLSHDSVVWVKDYDTKGTFMCIKEGSDTYDNIPGMDYLEVDYDILRPDPSDTRKHPTLKVQGRRVCRYAQPSTGLSTLPKILQKLLSARKTTRKLAEKETDDFRRALLDAQQLAYKLTANSLYGQLGSNTSKIRRKCLAASTTGHGRQQLLFSKACIEQAYGAGAKDPRCDAVVVYGDTDSVFISFRPKDPVSGERLTGRKAQEAAKMLAEEAGGKISSALKSPHDFEFDKMFRCFCLLSKKRYVGDMTEGGLEESDYHRKSMGIVMKRRDNAPIVKYVYGGAIESILSKRDILGGFQFVQQAAKDLLAGKFSMKRLTITKSLRAEYKLVPAHKILADRIGRRDPGNKPSSNDRIPFVYVAPPRGQKPPALQGDRIETPTYIQEKGLKPDYPFYITNQIAKPISQVFGLVVDRLPGVKAHQLEAAAKARDPVAAREAIAEELLFGDMLREAVKKASGQTDMRSFFKSAK